MADIYGSHFEYGGVDSRMYDLVFANINTNRWTKLCGESEPVTIYSKRAQKNYLIDDDHSNSPVSLDAEITTESGRCLETAEQRQVEKWLFSMQETISTLHKNFYYKAAYILKLLFTQ